MGTASPVAEGGRALSTDGGGTKKLTINKELFRVNEVVWASVVELGAELDRLRAVIENAPHTDACDRSRIVVDRSIPGDCTCWKADAL